MQLINGICEAIGLATITLIKSLSSCGLVQTLNVMRDKLKQKIGHNRLKFAF